MFSLLVAESTVNTEKFSKERDKVHCVVTEITQGQQAKARVSCACEIKQGTIKLINRV